MTNIKTLKLLLNVFGVGVSCRNLYSFVVYLYVNDSGSIASVGEERANLSAFHIIIKYTNSGHNIPKA